MPDAPLDASPEMSPLQIRVAKGISGVALGLLTLHVASGDGVKLDQGTLVVLAIAALPWMTLFFKKFTITGLVDAESRDRSQGSTTTPAPPAAAPRVQADETPPSDPAKKVLATLGRYQAQMFPSEPAKRWTFGVHPRSPDFANYLTGLAETVNAGWVAVSPENHQCMLTNEGLAFLHNHPEIRDHGEFWRF